MTSLSLLGIMIVAISVVLIGFGAKKTQTFTNKIMDGVTGHYLQRTRWYLIGGVIALLIGVTLIYLGWQPSTSHSL